MDEDLPQNVDSEESDPKKPERKRDRLMGAKERAEKQAKEWHEIEVHGDPVSSKESILEEPPIKEGDTPAGRPTPAEGTANPFKARPSAPHPTDEEPPAEQAKDDVPFNLPTADNANEERKPVAKKRTPFPHPTDPTSVEPVEPQKPATPKLKADSNQPVARDDQVKPEGYKRPNFEPETPIADNTPMQPSAPNVRMDDDDMPLPKRVPREDPNSTMVGLSAFKDEIDDPSMSENTIRRKPVQPPPDQQVTQRNPRMQSPPPPYSPPPPGNRSRAPRPSSPQPRAPQQPSYQQPPQQRYAEPPRQRQPVRSSVPPPFPREQEPQRDRRKRRRKRRRRTSFATVVTRLFVLGFVGLLIIVMLGGGGGAIYYAQVTAPAFRGIDDVSDLQARALGFETTRIRDRDGNILYELNDPEGGFRDTVTLDQVSPYMIHATISTEERGYFINPGFSIPGIIRAVYQNYQEGALVSGASTITQQLVRALLLTEEDLAERVSYQRKVKEIFLAAELERRFTKEEILELYLNEVYYGNLAYGIEAAAQTYFNKSASELTLAESAYLAGIPQAPAVWDPVADPEAAALRQRQVLALMVEAGQLDTGNVAIDLPVVTSAVVEENAAEIAAVASAGYSAPDFGARHPHWVFYVIRQLEQDPAIGQSIYSAGFDVYTTLDSDLQQAAEQQVEATLAGLEGRNVTNASVVVIDVDTGAILAMVGSRDFFNEGIDGQVNIALTPQQPGSSIKPFTYLAAFRQGWTPSTVIWDVPIQYEIPGFGVYEPVNYDGRFRGPVSVRDAIANSYNIPAVLTLDYVGVPALLEVLNDVGITSLGDASNPNNYGLSLTLGAGEVFLLEWTNAYATLANGGTLRPPYSIDRIERNGEVIEGYPYEVPAGEQVLNPDRVYLMQTILSDTEARVPSFGRETPLSPSYPAGAKTGTTNDFRDNWTMGFSSEVAVGVWVGNTDNSPMINVTGVTGAGPIWRGVMDAATSTYSPQPFPRLAGVFDQVVCIDDGAEPSEYCLENSETRLDVFDLETPPPTSDMGLYRTIEVDTFTGLIANEFCPNYTEERATLFVPNPSQLIDVREAAFNWLRNSEPGRSWAAQRRLDENNLVEPPEAACSPDTQTTVLEITNPTPGQTVQGNILITGSVNVPNFEAYVVQFGLGTDPQGWGEVQGRTSQTIDNNALGQFDTEQLPNGPVTIRLIAFDTNGNSAETRVQFLVDNPQDDEDD